MGFSIIWGRTVLLSRMYKKTNRIPVSKTGLLLHHGMILKKEQTLNTKVGGE